jgi:hypothetical protein
MNSLSGNANLYFACYLTLTIPVFLPRDFSNVYTYKEQTDNMLSSTFPCLQSYTISTHSHRYNWY